MTNSSTNELVVLVKESQLPKSKAEYILENFKGYFELAKEWEKKAESLIVTRDDQVAEMKMAREGRLFLAKKRIAIENARKDLKAEALREGQTIDSIARVLKNLIIPIEEHLEQQEKFLEIKEKLRKKELREHRINAIQNFEDLIPFEHYPDVENWDENFWQSYILGLETQHKQKQKEIREAEAERKKAEESERKRIQALELHHKRSNMLAQAGLSSDKHLGLMPESDFLILKKDLEAQRKKEEEARKAEQIRLKAEAEKREREIEAKLKLEEEARKKAEAERAKRDRELAEMQKRAEAEQKKKDEEIRKMKAEAEAKRKLEEEAQKKAEAEARKKAEAPDIEKAKQLLDELRSLKIPAFKTEKFQKLGHFIDHNISEMLGKIFDHPEFKEIVK